MKNSFAKDKNNVYYRGRKMNFINPDKFQILDEYFAKDDKNLYQYFDFNPNIEIIKNPDIDINTFDIYIKIKWQLFMQIKTMFIIIQMKD